MSKKYDLEYKQVDGMFYAFYPLTKEGERVWNQMANTEGMECGKVLSVQADQVLYQLRKAGYSVRKMKKVEISIDDILDELDGL